jgi:hypothetical protein
LHGVLRRGLALLAIAAAAMLLAAPAGATGTARLAQDR